MLLAFQGMLQPFLEKITGRIAVSELARQVQVEHLGGDAVIIPNGVDVQFFARATPLPGYPRAGALFPVGDADALAGTIGTLLDDPDRRAELASRATRVVAGFDWPAVAARVVEVYATAIEAAPRMVADLD